MKQIMLFGKTVHLDFILPHASCIKKKMYAPAAYSAVIAIELLLKGTLIYWDPLFNPQEDGGHGMAKMVRMVKDKAHASELSVPRYFYQEQRYLNVSRYPSNDKGVCIPATFLDDLDKAFVDLTFLVPFQHNTELRSALSERSKPKLITLRYKNKQMPRLRKSY